MSRRALILSNYTDAPYLEDANLYYALPAYADLADAAAAAEDEWLKAKRSLQETATEGLLNTYKASLSQRRCRLFGTLLARKLLPSANKAYEADLYVKIRLAARSETYKDRIYECRYTAAHPEDLTLSTITDFANAEIGEDVRLFGRLSRDFGVPGFYLARARLFRGEKRDA